MADMERAAYKAVLKLMRYYRDKYLELVKKTTIPKTMTIDAVKRILRGSGSARMVDTALLWVNLTDDEMEAIRLCYRRGLTQEKAAEIMDRSRNAVYLWCQSGLEKIRDAWAGETWLLHTIR